MAVDFTIPKEEIYSGRFEIDGMCFVREPSCATCVSCDKRYPTNWWCEKWNAGNGMCYDGNYCGEWEGVSE